MKIMSTFHVVSLVVLLTMSIPLVAFGAPDPTQQADPVQRAKSAKQGIPQHNRSQSQHSHFIPLRP